MTRNELTSKYCSIELQIKICTRAKVLLQKGKCNTLCTALTESLAIHSVIDMSHINSENKHKSHFSPKLLTEIIPAFTYDNAVKNGNAKLDERGFWWPLTGRCNKRNIQPRVEFLEFIVDELKQYR